MQKILLRNCYVSKFKYLEDPYKSMSDHVKELIKIANTKAHLNEAYDDDEWDTIFNLSEEMAEGYYSKLSGAAQWRFVIEAQKRSYKDLGKAYQEENMDFKVLENKLNELLRLFDGFTEINNPKTKKELHYGYSWSFLSVCNKGLGISLRKLERETGISKDVIHKYISNYEQAQVIQWKELKVRRELKELELKKEKIKL